MVNGHIVKDQTNFRWDMHKYISKTTYKTQI